MNSETQDRLDKMISHGFPLEPEDKKILLDALEAAARHMEKVHEA